MGYSLFSLDILFYFSVLLVLTPFSYTSVEMRQCNLGVVFTIVHRVLAQQRARLDISIILDNTSLHSRKQAQNREQHQYDKDDTQSRLLSNALVNQVGIVIW